MIHNATVNALAAIENKTLGELFANNNLKKISEGIIKQSYEVLKGD